MNQLLAMRAFLRVVETGSFSRASEQLGLPRSSVSKLITDLERHLGVTLMHRTTRAVATTADGLEYYNQALRLIAEIESVDNSARSQKLKPSGHLRIDAPASFANTLLIPALPEFRRRYPDISIALGISDRTINIVGEGVDCVFRAGELDDMLMIGRKVTDLEYVTCASARYLEEMGTPISPSDLQHHHLHAGYFSAATGKPQFLLFERGNERYEILNCTYSTNEGTGLISLMRAGLGVGQHLRRFVQPHLDSGELVEVLSDWRRPSIPLHAVYPPNRHQSARLKVFIDWAVEALGR